MSHSGPNPEVVAPGPASDAHHLAQAALTHWGLPAEPLHLVRHSINTLYRARAANLAIRVAPPGLDPRTGETVTARAAALGLPVLAPHPDHPSVLIDGRWVSASAWHDTTADAALDWGWLGATTRAIHDHGPALATGLTLRDLNADPGQWIHGRTTGRLAALAETPLPAADIALLTDTTEAVLARIDAAPPIAPIGTPVIHVDLHPGNVLHTTTAGSLILDWDSTCHGPWWFDHLPAAVQTARFGTGPAAMTAFTTGYGADPTTEPLFQAWTDAKILSGTLWLALLCTARPELRPEYETRMYWWRTGDPTPWTVI